MTDSALIIVLVAVVILGVVAMWRWGALEVTPPWGDVETWPLPSMEGARRFFWYATVGVMSGICAGLVTFGAGGRLAMRLLAVTAGDAAQGQITEAREVVGRVTLDGTLGFIGFFGIFAGTLFGLLYMAVRHWLPRGRWGGLTFGLLLLIVLATRVDPLRPENRDFDIVGPGWVSVAVFSAVMVAYGMLVAAVAGRYSRVLPPLQRKLRTIAPYVPPYVISAPTLLLLGVPLVAGCLVAAMCVRTEGLRELVEARRVTLAGRVLGALLGVVALPGFVVGIADIVTRR